MTSCDDWLCCKFGFTLDVPGIFSVKGGYFPIFYVVTGQVASLTIYQFIYNSMKVNFDFKLNVFFLNTT